MRANCEKCEHRHACMYILSTTGTLYYTLYPLAKTTTVGIDESLLVAWYCKYTTWIDEYRCWYEYKCDRMMICVQVCLYMREGKVTSHVVWTVYGGELTQGVLANVGISPFLRGSTTWPAVTTHAASVYKFYFISLGSERVECDFAIHACAQCMGIT